MESKILIIGESNDPQVDSVACALGRIGIQASRFTDSDALNYGFAVRFVRGSMTGYLRSSSGPISLEPLRSIYWRRPAPVKPVQRMTEQDMKFARTELDHVLQSLWATKHCYWMNYPGHIGRAKFLPHQLHVAARIGMSVSLIQVANGATDPNYFQPAWNGQVRRFLLERGNDEEGEVHQAADQLPFLLKTVPDDMDSLYVVCVANCCYAFLNGRYLIEGGLDALLADFCLKFLKHEKLELCGIRFTRNRDGWVFLGAEPDCEWVRWDKLTPNRDISTAIAAVLCRAST